MTAEEALGAQLRQDDKRGQGKVEASGDWLRVQLKNGPLPARELERRAIEADMSWASVRRAQHVLRIRPQKSGKGPWVWALPDKGVQAPNTEQLEHLEQLQSKAEESGPSKTSDLITPTKGAQGAQGNGSSVFDGNAHLWPDREKLRDLVPDGWHPVSWADRLDQLATGCEELNPDLAAQYRKQAAAIRARLKGR